MVEDEIQDQVRRAA